ncbi:hypothetical protein ABFA07_000332 [Porites harrisoni]
MSKIAGTEGFYSSDSPKESSASEMGISSEETVALKGRSAQNLNSTSGNLIIKNDKIELENQTTRRQLCEGIYLKLDDRSTSLGTTTKIESGSPILSSDYPSRLTESSLGVKTPESCRFVHFKEQRKISKRKSKKGNCVEKSRGKEKLNRTRSLGLKLFQFDGLQFPQKEISKEEIENETRQKMNQFFAKVEHTKTCQTSTPRWRCTSGVDIQRKKSRKKNRCRTGKKFSWTGEERTWLSQG